MSLLVMTLGYCSFNTSKLSFWSNTAKMVDDFKVVRATRKLPLFNFAAALI
jgi:hypothetical protein